MKNNWFRMKNVWFVIFLFSFIVLSACGGDEATESEKSAPPETIQGTVVESSETVVEEELPPTELPPTAVPEPTPTIEPTAEPEQETAVDTLTDSSTTSEIVTWIRESDNLPLKQEITFVGTDVEGQITQVFEYDVDISIELLQ